MKTQPNPTRRMSVRAIVTLLAVVLGGLSLLVLSELVLVTFWMHQATERMASGAEGVRAAEQLDVSLRAYNREKFLLARTGDESHASSQEKIASEINESLAAARQHIDTEEEASLLKGIEAKVREFMTQPQIPSRSKDPSAFSAYLEGSQTVDNIGEEV